MVQAKYPMVSDTFKRLEKELHDFKTKQRPEIIKAIAEARAHGDLSENAEYHAAKERQGFIEAKIKDLEFKLSHAHVIDITKISGEHIQFGATVCILDEETNEEIIYQIVSEFDADAAKKHISITSPVSRALMGKKSGDSIEVATPKGHRYFEIISVEYKS